MESTANVEANPQNKAKDIACRFVMKKFCALKCQKNLNAILFMNKLVVEQNKILKIVKPINQN